MLPPNNIADASKQSVEYIEYSPETLRLNACEDAPINKLIFKITPTENIRIGKIDYSMLSTDASVNGYVSIIVSKVNNPNIYAVSQSASQIIFEKMTNSTGSEGSEHFFDNVVLYANEPVYIFMVSNFPSPAKAIMKMTIYYNVIHI